MNQNPDPIAAQVDLFAKDAAFWWKAGGPFDLLHAMNPLRLDYIKECVGPLTGFRVLDVGCGGGILAEPLARLGAIVTGIDATESAVEVARDHAQKAGLDITYHCTTVEAFQQKLPDDGHFDIVIASEIIEHVADPASFLKACILCAKRGLIVSTINRTPKSYLGAIIGAEYLLRWVPRGTHEWDRFLKPSDVDMLMQQAFGKGAPTWGNLQGMKLNPFTKQWSFTKDLSVNYIGWILC